MTNHVFVNRKLERIRQVFEILDKYPVKDVNVHRRDICIDLEPGTKVTESDQQKLIELEVHNHIIETSWEIFL